MDDFSRQELHELDKDVDQIGRDVIVLKTQMAHISASIKTLVSQSEFFPVKLIVYGLAAGSMGAVMTQILSSIMSR